MSFQLLDTVVLLRDFAEYSLKAGDLGVIVHIYESDGYDVEFVTASGRTTALVTLGPDDFRSAADTDRIAVRSIKRSA